MNDDQPLTCVRCRHAPASRLLVIRWRDETLRLLCADCAAEDEADAPGLPGFRSLTVLAVGPVGGMVTEWGVRHDAQGGRMTLYPDEVMAREWAEISARPRPVMSRQVTPWTPVPGEGKGDG